MDDHPTEDERRDDNTEERSSGRATVHGAISLLAKFLAVLLGSPIKLTAGVSDNRCMRSILSPPGGRTFRSECPLRPSSDLVAAESAVLVIGGLSIVTGIIHVGIAASDFQLSSSYTPPIAMFAAFQLGWGALVALRCSRGALIWGAAANAAIAAIWVASRTVGMPIGPQPWVPEPVGVVDVIAAAAESVVVLASSCVVLAARSSLARRAVSRMPPVLLGALFIGVLYGVGGGGHIGGGGSIWLCG